MDQEQPSAAATGVRSAAVKAVAAGVYLAIAAGALTGPASLALLLSSDRKSATVRTEGSELPLERSGELAQSFTAAWLSASQQDHRALESFGVGSSVLPVEGRPYRDLAVASAEEAGERAVVAVVAASVLERRQADGRTVESWPRRYYQVTIAVDGERIAPVGFPSPVAAPAEPERSPVLAYPAQLGGSSPVWQTVDGFLNAYAAGRGEIGRYTVPGSVLRAIADAPAVELKVKAVRAEKDPGQGAADGERVRVLAQAELLSAGAAQGQPTSYALTLVARAGRWEVEAIDPAPVFEKPPPTPRSAHREH